MVQTPSPPRAEANSESAVTLAALVNEINQFEAIVSEWDEAQRATVAGLRRAIEALHREALLRLIRQVKQEALPALRHAAEDELVYGLLRYYELVKPPTPPLAQRLQLALDEVRPGLQSHQGDVELVTVDPPLVEVRLIGTCGHCPAAGLTLSQGVEEAIKRHCPEITQVVAVQRHEGAIGEERLSPFATPDAGWLEVTALAEVPRNGVLAMKLEGRSLLLSRVNDRVVCFQNACSHLGVPVDAGEVEEGVLTCPYHHFRYDLATGECLTSPQTPLFSYPVEIRGGQVYVQLWGNA